MPPRAFLQLEPEMRLWDTVEFAHMPLGLVPEIFNAVDVMSTFGKEL